MVTFPARKITDKRIYRNDGTSTVLFHDNNYSKKLIFQEIKDLNIRFNLYDLERKIFVIIKIFLLMIFIIFLAIYKILKSL